MVQGQLHNGGVAAEVGHQACLIMVYLCQTIYSLLLKLWGSMLSTIPSNGCGGEGRPAGKEGEKKGKVQGSRAPA